MIFIILQFLLFVLSFIIIIIIIFIINYQDFALYKVNTERCNCPSGRCSSADNAVCGDDWIINYATSSIESFVGIVLLLLSLLMLSTFLPTLSFLLKLLILLY